MRVCFINRETVSYIVFGVITSIINIGIFQAFLRTGADYRIANIVALVATKISAYILNKAFVFRSKTETLTGLLSEFVRFTITRGGTMILDYVGLIILVNALSMNTTAGKVLITGIVVIINYLLGKHFVFTSRNRPLVDPREIDR